MILEEGNYNELKNICSRFSTTEEVDDLLHLCLEEFMKNIKYQGNHTKTRLQKSKQRIKKMSFKLHLSLNSISAVELKKT